MNILSLYIGHNSTIAYLKGNKLAYVLHEEKFDNIKNSDNFPLKCFAYLKTQEDLSQIDKIVVVGKAINRRLLRYIETYTKADKHNIISYHVTLYDRILYILMRFFPRLMNRVNDVYIWLRQKKYTQRVYDLISQWLGYQVDEAKVSFISHHEAHALSVIYFYGLHQASDPVLVMTLDGGGDKHCATVSVRDQGNLERIAAVRNRYSLGDIRSKAVTGWLGMKPLEHEYKVMGLAAYTSPEYYQSVYEELFKDKLKLDWLTRTSKVPWNKAHIYYHNKFRGHRFDNIAGALQAYTEEHVLQWIKNAVEKTGIKRIAFSGGVFMNVKLNQKIQEQNYLEKVYFMPSAGDESTPLGGVLGGYRETKEDLASLEAVNTMFSGVRYTDQAAQEILWSYADKYTLSSFSDEHLLIEKITDLLQNFEIVAIFHGAGERGARSLCHRAILANASNLRSFHRVNDLIKMRDFRMPFAPTLLEERADKYIQDRPRLKDRVAESSYRMITAFDSTPLAQKDLVAAIHQKDKTLRPQLVTAASNAFMYNILKSYEAKTGMGGIMNTSLNIHGYPLVGTIEQALFTLENSGLEHIVINNVLVSKKNIA